MDLFGDSVWLLWVPQYGCLSNDLLRKTLNKEGYFESSKTPGLWRHKWGPIQCMLIVDDFRVDYVGRKHTEHLASDLKNYHDISDYWEGKKFAGVDLIWDYAQKNSSRTCKLSMTSYIAKLLLKVGHKLLVNKQISLQC